MKTHSITNYTLRITAAFALWLGSVPLASSAPPHAHVAVHKIGHPTWKPVDFHLFTAEVGTSDTYFAEYFENLQEVLPPPNHLLHPDLGLGPGAPHPGPYDEELEVAIDHADFREATNFRASEFIEGSAVWFVWMNVPHGHAPTGRSVDFTNGPIIPNSLFPIHLAWDVYHNGVLDGETSYYDRPPLTEVNPPFDVDGDSHYPQFLILSGDDEKGARGNAGTWEHRATLTDSQGNGWGIRVSFKVSPKT